MGNDLPFLNCHLRVVEGGGPDDPITRQGRWGEHELVRKVEQ